MAKPKPPAPKVTLDAQMTFRTTKDIKERVEAEAASRDISMGDLMNWGTQWFLDELKAEAEAAKKRPK